MGCVLLVGLVELFYRLMYEKCGTFKGLEFQIRYSKRKPSNQHWKNEEFFQLLSLGDVILLGERESVFKLNDA